MTRDQCRKITVRGHPAHSASTGAFTTLSASSTLSVTGAGTIQGLTVGRGAGAVSTNTAVGASALAANTSGSENIAIGTEALRFNTTGARNTALAWRALYNNTTGVSNTAVSVALPSNTTGSYNTAVGDQALQLNTTASNNTAVGYQAGYTNQTGRNNLFLGYQAGFTSNHNTDNGNTCIGNYAGYYLTTGTANTFVGSTKPSGGIGSGINMTTGSSNTILGNFTGNQGGLDIRTASNYIVLSDGDGNPRAYWNGSTGVNNGSFVNQGDFSTPSRIYAYYNGAANDPYGVISVTAPADSNSYAGFAQTRQGNIVFGWGINNSNEMWFGQVGSGVVSSTQRLRINGNGPYTPSTFGVGGANPSTSGGGITFPANQLASSDPNTLDDYEEGTFTPIYAGSSSNPTVSYNQQSGRYIKIGQFVQITVEIETTSVAGGGGDLYVGGLPFAALNDRYVGGAVTAYASSWTTRCPRSGYFIIGGTTIALTSDTSATGQTNIPTANLTTTGTSNYLIMTAVYRAAA